MCVRHREAKGKENRETSPVGIRTNITVVSEREETKCDVDEWQPTWRKDGPPQRKMVPK